MSKPLTGMGEIIKINDKQYHIQCVTCYQGKVPHKEFELGLKVGIEVRRMSDNKVLEWSDIKGSYLAEKITDFVENSINGQRTFYWDWRKENE